MEAQPWVKIADALTDIAFAPNGIADVLVGAKRICIARYNNIYFAFAPQCPHAGARFAEGFIDALGNVVCPLHRYKFCLKNGRNVSGEGYYLKRWPLKIDSGVYINFNVL